MPAPRYGGYILYQSYQGPPPQQQGESITADKWIYPWSDPVRVREIPISLIVSGLYWNPQQPLPPATWFAALNEPVRLPKRLHAALNPFLGPFVPQPQGTATQIQGWFDWLAEPVRQKPGLSVRFQQAFAGPERLLPTPNIFVTMDATETNNDIALFGVNIPTSGGAVGQSGAEVSITEIQANDDAGMSIREP